ncbi:MAG: SCO family protein [Acidimicrobiaceae bacterium]|nr:SCO family protein [Acidimicrobiaceae bacterium]
MPGMGGGGYSNNNPIVANAFTHSVLVTCMLWIIGIAFVVMVFAVVTRGVLRFNLSEKGLNEARSRSYLRWAFGAMWLFDGILQFQVSMPLGLANNVVQPATAGTPGWLHALMLHGISLWNAHPIALADATAWIQVGIGVLLLVSNGGIGRVAATLSVGWAGMIWLIGNGAGGIFQTSSNILFGWPGATFFYVVAGVWLALTPENFPERFSRVTLRFVAALLGVALVLQVLPNRQFWHGGNSNALTTMTQSMVKTPQPHWLAYVVTKFGVLAGTLGGGFNLIIIFWLAVSAVGLWLSPIRQWRWPVWLVASGAIVFWVGAQDGAIFGGLATDLNSLVPLAVLTLCASPTLVRRPALVRRLPAELRSSTGSVLSSFATGMVIFSLISMSLSTFASAENTLYLAQNGPASAVNTSAPSFTLTDQHGASYSLGEHLGYYTLVTFLDPVCYTDCPLLAGQMKQVGAAFGPRAKLDLVAVAANPRHETMADVRTFIAKHDLGSAKNFYFVTGTLAHLAKVWGNFGIQVESSPTTIMSVHSDIMFVISPQGRIQWIIPDNPISTSSGQSSAVTELITLLGRAGLK